MFWRFICQAIYLELIDQSGLLKSMETIISFELTPWRRLTYRIESFCQRVFPLFQGFRHITKQGEEQGGKSPFSLLSEPISPSSLLFWANFSLLPKRLRFFFSLLPTFSPYFSLLPTFFGPFLPPPYSVPPPSTNSRKRPLKMSNLVSLSFILITI